jgi:hypothetical protein
MSKVSSLAFDAQDTPVVQDLCDLEAWVKRLLPTKRVPAIIALNAIDRVPYPVMRDSCSQVYQFHIDLDGLSTHSSVSVISPV